MATGTSRRDFLRARFEGDTVVRPFGAVKADRFHHLCDGCGDCVSACPEGIVVTGNDQKAQLSFANGACTFCGACTEACPTGALVPEAQGDWDWIASIGGTCLSLNGVTCRTCEDACDARAIRFRLAIGGRAHPMIDDDACTGCGACVTACPVGAVNVVRHQTQHLEATG